MKCPNCSHQWTPDSSELAAEAGRKGGQQSSRAKTRAARANAKLGGWPKGKKRGKRKPDANQIAHGVVAQAEKITGNPNLRHYEALGRTDGITRQGRAPQRLKVLPSPKAPKRGR